MKLLVKPIANGATSGLLLHDALTGAPLPNQQAGTLDYAGGDLAKLSVNFYVDGADIRMWQGEPLDEIAAEVAEKNDLAAASRAYAALSDANKRRFGHMYGLAKCGAVQAITLGFDASAFAAAIDRTAARIRQAR